jgi:hypothetical protein
MYTKCNDLTMPHLSRVIHQAAMDLVNDNEQNHYVLCHLMQQLNIDTTSESAYSNLYLYLIETVDQLIDEIPSSEEYFSAEASDMIDDIDTVMQCIESFASISYDSQMFLYNQPYTTI